MELKIDRLVSPIGEILLVCDGEALAALDFIEAEARQARNLRRRQPSAELVPGPAPRFIRTRLEAYFAGEEADLDAIPVKTGGTAFQERVWAALREIPFGQTTSYGKLAATLGMPTACRAVGMANGANPVSIVVPCHPPSQAARFHEMHLPGQLLILPNAWDAASARLIEEAGSRAIATTSAGLAWARGYADGGALSRRVLAAAVAEISRVVKVPVTVDVEAGYSHAPESVAEMVKAVIDGGAVGINIEDGADAPDLLAAKIAAVKAASMRAGIDLFVNARTDVYLQGLAEGEEAVAEVTRRAARYRKAGADGIFVPGLSGENEIGQLVRAVAPLPLNLMAVPGLAPAASLKRLGVRRLSAGAAIATAALGLVGRLAAGFLATGDSDPLFAGAADYAGLNALFPQAETDEKGLW